MGGYGDTSRLAYMPKYVDSQYDDCLCKENFSCGDFVAMKNNAKQCKL
jgi:hypothetical protein